MSDTLTVLEATEPSLDEPKVAHIVKKDGLTDAYVFGTPLVSLCGIKFVPSRDPEQYPVCQECAKRLREILFSGNN